MRLFRSSIWCNSNGRDAPLTTAFATSVPSFAETINAFGIRASSLHQMTTMRVVGSRRGWTDPAGSHRDKPNPTGQGVVLVQHGVEAWPIGQPWGPLAPAGGLDRSSGPAGRQSMTVSTLPIMPAELRDLIRICCVEGRARPPARICRSYHETSDHQRSSDRDLGPHALHSSGCDQEPPAYVEDRSVTENTLRQKASRNSVTQFRVAGVSPFQFLVIWMTIQVKARDGLLHMHWRRRMGQLIPVMSRPRLMVADAMRQPMASRSRRRPPLLMGVERCTVNTKMA